MGNYNYASTLQTVPKEGSQTRTLPLQVYNYNHNYNYTSTLQTVPKEGGPPRAKPLQTQPQLQLQHHPTKDRRETPPSVLPSSKPTSGSFCYLPSSLKCEYYHTCCRGRNNLNDCPATVSFQCNIPIGAFPRWEVSRLVFRVGRYVCY